MFKVAARSTAKLNLTFAITGLLPDGYHEVETLMQSVSLEDELIFELANNESAQVVLRVEDSPLTRDFPVDQNNLICQAFKLFTESIPEIGKHKLTVTVNKRIPIGAGLAGGSGNAAATLVALNYLFKHPLSQEELTVLGSKLGADVPFCLDGGTAIGSGRGDKLSSVEPSTRLQFAIVKPRNLSLPTAWVYQAYDKQGEVKSVNDHPDLDGAINGLKWGDLELAFKSFGNVFEPVVFSRFPELLKLKDAVAELGAFCCHMTGSGPTLYAVVPDHEAAHFMRRKLLEMNYDVDFFFAESTQWGARLVD